MSYEYNRGSFKLNGEMLRDNSNFHVLAYMMDRVVVFHIEANFYADTITYFACHPAFEKVSPAVIPPEYTAIITESGDGHIEVEWRKVE